VLSPFRITPKLARLSAVGVAVGSLAGGFLVLDSASPAGASGTLYVSSYGSDAGGNPCTSKADPCLTLQHAYNEAGGGTTTINLAPGTYKGDFGVPSMAFAHVNWVEKNLNIVGSDNGGSLNATTTTISGEGGPNALVNVGVTVNLTDLVANDAVGETIDNGGTMTLTDVTIGSSTGEPAFEGAGIVNEGTLTMNGGSISGNVTASFPGAGLYNSDGDVATLDSVSVTHNSTTWSKGEGGGIFNEGTVHLKGTTALHNNSATVTGGGIEECASVVGTTITIGPDVVDTSNAPNDLNKTDPAGDC
jgi:hypothetical protein